MKSQKTIATSSAILGRAVKVSLALILAGCTFVLAGTAHAQQLTSAVATTGDDASATYLSADDLDNIMAPIALYPDPLLAQVLVATTFSDQIDSAAQFVSSNIDSNAIDYQPWDTSVKAVAHYPQVLLMAAEQPDWSASVGQAYVVQSTDVMTSIQRLRALALTQGNLINTPQQRVIAQGGIIQILPAQANYIFVPAYNSSLVFAQPALITFGPRLVIHESLVRQIDWRSHRIYDIHNRYGRVPVGRVRRDRVRSPERLRTRERFPQRVGSPVRQPGLTSHTRCDTPGVAGCAGFGPNKTRGTAPGMPTTPTKTRGTAPGMPTTPTKTRSTAPGMPTTPTKTRGTAPSMPTTPTKTRSTAPGMPTTPTKTRSNTPGMPTNPTKTRGTTPGMPSTSNQNSGTARAVPRTSNRTRGTAPAPATPNKTRGYVSGGQAADHTVAGGPTMQAPNLGRGGRHR